MFFASSKKYSETSLSLALFFCGGVWGLYWIPLRNVESLGVSGAWSVFFVNACPLIFLLPILGFIYSDLKREFWPSLAAGSVIGIAFTLYASALVETTILRATLLFYLSPIWGTFIGIIWLGEKLTYNRILSVLVAIFGLILLLWDTEKSGYPLNIGDVFGFFCGVFWAIGSSLLNRWPKTPMLPLTTFVYLTTAIISLILAIFFYKETFPQKALLLSSFPSTFFWSTVILLPSFVIVFKISQILFPGRVAILLMSEVIVAIVSASILVPEEKMFFVQWIGATAIILAGLIEVLPSSIKKNRV